MSNLHRLLQRQLKRHFGPEFCVPEEWRGVLADISDAYQDFDTSRELSERSLVLSSQELQTANEQLKAEMAERSKTEEVLRQAQKMEAVGQLAGGIAHDFNNLLTIIRGYVQCLALEEHQSPDMLEAVREIDVAAKRAAKLTSQMLMFSRKKLIQPQSLNLNGLIAQLGTMLRRLVGENIALEIQAGETPLEIHADPVMIEMVILNLAVNARDAMPQGGRLTIRTGEIEIMAKDSRLNSTKHPGRFARIIVEDTGSGITPEVLPHLFEPFFTTKEVGKGTGLGLASSYGIVKQHGGWMEAESDPGHGARFKIFLPIKTRNSGSAPAHEPKKQIHGGSETVLLVEDENALRRLTRMVLQRQGYRVLEAGSGVEALSVWDEHAAEIDLLLTDMIMPEGLSGRELADKLREKKSHLKVIYTSGYSSDIINSDLALNEGLNFLAKPYHPDKLIQIVRRCLDENSTAHTPDIEIPAGV